ncbi:FHA domain-containing protein [Frigoribacterium sp. CG_9.8]|uniref:FHA domain-containing protein n=1 Tax=Frigoribacterium sp. CG_9.8 TaxID=2787733 RepID=UPI0018CBB825|nr:FHA domain-containing protein [Frigoribacterium sp. CG_9.8]MBG6107671.1 hypothetical protein [Frigoribacterium sp. CG_9.8]
MQPDDTDHTVIRPRSAGERGGERAAERTRKRTVEPVDLDAATVIRVRAPAAQPVSVEPPALVEPPRGHSGGHEGGVLRRAGLPIDPVPLAVPWYRIRVNRHEPIPLDTPALIGRKPVPPRITVGGAPRLVRVPSPGREVSGTHVELRQQGASVIVTDLRSTNGTLVWLPGTRAQKLRQGESLVVSAGTVVDIGDGNTVEILPIERQV